MFDFGDPSGTYGLTMSWDIQIQYPQFADDDTDDPPNFASLFVVNYETGEWRRVFLTGNTGSYSTEYSTDVYAAPGEFIRWVSYVDDDRQLNAQAELSFGFADDGEAEALECNPNHLLPDVKHVPDTNQWITTGDLGGDPDYNFLGVDYWILPNSNNERGFAACDALDGEGQGEGV